MKRRNKKRKESVAAGQAATHKPHSQRRKLPTWKKALFGLVTAVILLGLLEVSLALFGVKPVLYADDPYVGFAGNIPLFVEQSEPQGQVHMVTAPNKMPWFNPQRFPKEKLPGTYRIFSVGGSTTYGRPYDDSVSFSGWLRELLPVADPTRKWEVINAGGVSYASYRVAVVMEELVQYEPDLFIVYSGHNEFLERRTYKSLAEVPRVFTDTGGVISRTRIYAATKKMLNAGPSRPADARDAPTILKSEVDTILEHSVGPRDYNRDDTLREHVFGHYRFNLNRIIDVARSAGADVVLITPAVNLKDCSPFKSEHRKDLAAADARRFEALYSHAQKARTASRLEDALAALQQAGTIDDRYADLHYRRGLVLYDLGRYEEAKAALRRALEEDICPLRALTSINQIVVEVATRSRVPLIDFARMIEDRADHNIPGSDYFLDHVHPTIEGYRLLALRLIDTLARQNVVKTVDTWNNAAVKATTQKVESRLDNQAHGVALRNLATVFSWAGKLEEAERMATKASELLGEDVASSIVLGFSAANDGDFERAVRHYRQALEIDPTFAEAHCKLGDALSARGNVEQAIQHYREALEINPEYFEAHNNWGDLLSTRGELDQAVPHYRNALQINPDFAEAHNNWGNALQGQGKIDEAIAHYHQALEINSDYAEALNNLGNALLAKGNSEEAIRYYSQALQVSPDYAEAHYNWGNALSAQGQLEEAIAHYGYALQINSDHAEALNNLGNALLAKGNSEEAIRYYSQALEVNPDYAEAHYNWGNALLGQGRLCEAIRRYRQALKIRPEFAEAHSVLGWTLKRTGRIEAALQHFRHALHSKPDSPPPLAGMAWILATHTDPNVRDAKQAIQFAERAAQLTQYQNAAILDTLAAAYAAAGRYNQATKTAQAALELPSASAAGDLASQIRQRLELYRQGKTYREPVGAAGAIRP